MSDSADELILKMQHLEAQAKEQLRAREATAGLDRLKTAAQKIAYEAHRELAQGEALEKDAEEKLERAKAPGTPPLEAGELVRSAREQQEAARSQLTKARARINFALDQMSEVERREYEAFHAEVRAETHGQLAEDPLFNKG